MPVHGPVENVAMQDVAAVGEDAHPRVFQGGGEIVHAAAEEVVIDDHFPHVSFQQFIDHMAADQPGPADDQQPLTSDVHIATLLRGVLTGFPPVIRRSRHQDNASAGNDQYETCGGGF